MAIVVGTCAVMDLRLLGVGADVPLTALHGAPRLVWTGFFINAGDRPRPVYDRRGT
jgi:hypothetical protein